MRHKCDVGRLYQSHLPLSQLRCVSVNLSIAHGISDTQVTTAVEVIERYDSVPHSTKRLVREVWQENIFNCNKIYHFWPLYGKGLNLARKKVIQRVLTLSRGITMKLPPPQLSVTTARNCKDNQKEACVRIIYCEAHELCVSDSWRKKVLTHFWVNGAEVTVMCILGDVDVVVALVFTCRRAIHVSVLALPNTFEQGLEKKSMICENYVHNCLSFLAVCFCFY